MSTRISQILRAFVSVPLTRDRKTLRSFGFVMAGASALVATWFWWQSEPFWPLVFGYWMIASVAFLFFGLAFPIVLSPLEWVWMRFAHVMGFVMTRVILTITFFVAVLPTGLIFRLLGKDLLNRKLDPKATSYWIDSESDGPWTRPEKPY